jgi:hypothetical protein
VCGKLESCCFFGTVFFWKLTAVTTGGRRRSAFSVMLEGGDGPFFCHFVPGCGRGEEGERR